MSKPEVGIILTARLESYFHQELLQQRRSHHLRADDATLHYLTLLMSKFGSSAYLFDFSEQRLQIRPLALLYKEALEASTAQHRDLWLQRLGDIALFVASAFSGQLSRHFNDKAYCVSMGENAYSYLETACAQRPKAQAQAQIFGQLASQFERFVEALTTIVRPHDLSNQFALALNPRADTRHQ